MVVSLDEETKAALLVVREALEADYRAFGRVMDAGVPAEAFRPAMERQVDIRDALDALARIHVEEANDYPILT